MYKMADEEIIALCGLIWVAVVAAIGALSNNKNMSQESETLDEAGNTVLAVVPSLSLPVQGPAFGRLSVDQMATRRFPHRPWAKAYMSLVRET
jgi:hypothetical protein